MRLCVPIPCFFRHNSFEDAVRIVASLGYDAVEIYDWKGMSFSSAEDVLKETGVELLSMCTTEFRMTDPSFRSLWLDGLRESVEAANRLGVKKLITQVGPDTGSKREEQHNAILTTLENALPILEDGNVTIMLEPLNTYVDHPGYYLTSSKEGFDIVGKINHPNAKLVFDIYHQQISEGNIIPNIINNLDKIAHLHSAGHPGRHELQLGENNYNYIFDTIDKAGYQGACGLEYSPTFDPIASLKEAYRLYGEKNS